MSFGKDFSFILALVTVVVAIGFVVITSWNTTNSIYIDSINGLDSQECLISNLAGIPCRTLNYAFSDPSDSTCYILNPDTVYNITEPVASFENLNSITILGGKGSVIECSGEGIGLAFINVSNIDITSVTILHCAAIREREVFKLGRSVDKTINVGLFFFLCENVTMKEVNISFSPNAVGVAMSNVIGTNTILNSVFMNNGVFMNNSASFPYYGGCGFLLELFCDKNCNANKIKTDSVLEAYYSFTNSTFLNNTAYGDYGGGLSVFMKRADINSMIRISNCLFKNNIAQQGGGMKIMYNEIRNYIEIAHSILQLNSAVYGGGLSVLVFSTKWNPALDKEASLQIRHVTFQGNWGRFMGSALYTTQIGKLKTTVKIANSCFRNNIINSSTLGSTVDITSWNTSFEGNILFKNNTGTALRCTSSEVSFIHSNVQFAYNTGHQGGAIYLSQSYILINEKTEVLFINNTATDRGGAIYSTNVVLDYTHIPRCVIRHSHSLDLDFWNARFGFHNNADQNGQRDNSIHFSPLLPCSWTGENDYSSIFILHVFCWKNWLSQVSCYLKISSDNRNVQTFPSHNMHIFPGDDDGKSFEFLFIQKKGSLLLTGLSVGIDNDSEVYQCPPGFKNNNRFCECPSSTYNKSVSCSLFNMEIYMLVNHWMGFLNGEYLVGSCPPSFCKPTNASFVTLPDNAKAFCPPGQCKPTNASFVTLPDKAVELDRTVCSENRMGVMCGKCTEGTGPAVNSATFECVNCTNTDLLTNIAMYVASTYSPLAIIFSILIIFDIRLTSGPANAFILYSQIISSTYNSSENLMMKSLKAVYGIFSLNFMEEFLPPLCLCPTFNALTVLLLHQLSTLFPLVLVFLIYLCLKLKECCPFTLKSLITKNTCCFWRKRTLKESLLSALASFTILSHYKFIFLFYSIVRKQYLMNENGTTQFPPRVYYAGQYEFTDPEYTLYYWLPSTIIFYVFVYGPLFLLGFPLSIFEWCLHKITSLWALYPVDKVHAFLYNTFGECYKKNNVNLTLVYFIVRLFEADSESGIELRLMKNISLYIFIAGIIFIYQPYKNNFFNYVDFVIIIDLATMKLSSEIKQPVPSSAYIIQCMVVLPMLYMIVYIIWNLTNCCRQLKEQFLHHLHFQLTSSIHHMLCTVPVDFRQQGEANTVTGVIVPVDHRGREENTETGQLPPQISSPEQQPGGQLPPQNSSPEQQPAGQLPPQTSSPEQQPAGQLSSQISSSLTHNSEQTAFAEDSFMAPELYSPDEKDLAFTSKMLGVESVHNRFKITGKGTRMAVIDRGLHSHYALKGVEGFQIYKDESGTYTSKPLLKRQRVIKGKVEEFYTQDNSLPFQDSAEHHATAVAGIAGGKESPGILWGNAKVVTYPGGVAPDAELVMFILPYENLHEYRLAMAHALDMIINQKNFDVVLISSRTSVRSKKERHAYTPEQLELINSDEEAIRKKIRRLYYLDICIVAAAGNDGNVTEEMEFPANMREVIGVGSLTTHGNPASGTITGKADLCCFGEVLAPTPADLDYKEFFEFFKKCDDKKRKCFNLSEEECVFLQKSVDFKEGAVLQSKVLLAIVNEEERACLLQEFQDHDEMIINHEISSIIEATKKCLLMKFKEQVKVCLWSFKKGSSFAAPAIAGLICLIIQYAKEYDHTYKVENGFCESTVRKYEKLLKIITSARSVNVTKAPHDFFQKELSYFQTL